MNVGYRGHGRFVAIMPTTYTLGVDLECDLDVEVSWGAGIRKYRGKL